MRQLLICAVVVVTALVTGWTTTAAQPLTFGLHVHDPNQLLPLHVRVAEYTGADAVTVQFHWPEVEPAPGRFVWSAQEAAIAAARERGVTVVGVFAYPTHIPLAVEHVSRTGWPSGHADDWAFFVSNVVTRFGKHVDTWVIVSGAGRDGGSLFEAAEAEKHAAFARITAAAVRRIEPRAALFAAVPGVDIGWLQVFAHYGGMSAVDGLALDINRWPTGPAGLSVVVEDVRAVAQQHDEAPLLWAWEFGYPTHRGVSVTEPRRRGVTEDRQAAWLVQSHVLLALAGVPTVFYYELVDRGPDELDALHNFGLYAWKGGEKPAALSYSVMTNMLRGLHYARAGDVIQRPVLPRPVEAEPAVDERDEPRAGPGGDRPGAGALAEQADGRDEPGERSRYAERFGYDEEFGYDELFDYERRFGYDELDGAATSRGVADTDVTEDIRSGLPYHFVFDYELFEEQTKSEQFAVTAHVFTGERSTVIVVWAEPAIGDGGCRYGCGHVDILQWLDGVPVRAFDLFGEPLGVQTELTVGDRPLYIELPMELVH